MGNSKINKNLIPQVNQAHLKKTTNSKSTAVKSAPSEFDKIFQSQMEQKAKSAKAHEGLQISKHAQKRIEDRSLEFDQNEVLKLRDAIGKLKTKGGKDSLVVTDKAAYIIDVANEKVVTAMNKTDMNENVFTKIDSTLFMN